MADATLMGTSTYLVFCPGHGRVHEGTDIDAVNAACIAHWNAHHKPKADLGRGIAATIAAGAELRIYTATVTLPADIPT